LICCGFGFVTTLIGALRSVCVVFILFRREENDQRSQHHKRLSELDSQLAAISSSFQIPSCSLESAKKYLSLAFFHALNSSFGLCTRVRFCCLKDNVNHLIVFIPFHRQ
jgi:hypothetical protein